MLFDKRTRQPARHLVLSLSVSGLFAPMLAPLPADAAIVTLNNGDQITGELQQLNDGVLAFKSTVFGEVNIPWGNVSKLVSDDGVRIQLNNGAMVKGKLILDAGGDVAVDNTLTGEPKTLNRQDIAALNPAITDDAVRYSGKFDLGGTFNRGNSDDDQVHASGEFVARQPTDRYTLNWEINEASSADIKTTSNRRLLGQYDMFINPKNYLFVNLKAERDVLADLNLRTGIGGGYGHQFVDTDIRRLSGEVGISYIKEDYETSPDQSFPTLALGFKFERKFFSQRLVYFNNLSVDTSLEDTRDVLLRNRMGIRVPIANGINLSTQFNIDYDNEPAEDKKKTDTALIFSLGYAF